MKANEMTNEELAAELETQCKNLDSFCRFAVVRREAAARLRKHDVLLAKLKVTEDALRGLHEIVCDDCKSLYMVDGKCVKCPRVQKAEAALAAIREEGGSK